MSTDKDLEAIKNGQGLEGSSSSDQSSGTTTEQRGQDSGIRSDCFSRENDSKKNGDK
jgi:hypothetical protein